MRRRLVLVLAGPTGVGKTNVAVALAERALLQQQQLQPHHHQRQSPSHWEAVVADSVQVQRGVSVLANVPRAEDGTQEVLPHHLLGRALTSGGDFARAAKRCVDEIHARQGRPVVLGGSTLWLDWLVHGVRDAPKSSPALRAEAKHRIREVRQSVEGGPVDGTAGQHSGFEEVVRILDEQLGVNSVYEHSMTALKNNWRRLERAVEVRLADPELTLHDAFRAPVLNPLEYDVRCIFLSQDRLRLYRSLEERCIAMCRAGAFEEVRDLILSGNLEPVADAVGYRQVAAYLTRDAAQSGDLDAMRGFLCAFAQANRNYAKLQFKWFRRDPAFLWLPMRPAAASAVPDAAAAIEQLSLSCSRDEWNRLRAQQLAHADMLEGSAQHGTGEVAGATELQYVLRCNRGQLSPTLKSKLRRRQRDKWLAGVEESVLRELVERADACTAALCNYIGT